MAVRYSADQVGREAAAVIGEFASGPARRALQLPSVLGVLSGLCLWARNFDARFTAVPLGISAHLIVRSSDLIQAVGPGSGVVVPRPFYRQEPFRT